MKLNKLNKETNYNKDIVKVKIINTKGSAPTKINDIMLVSLDNIYGTIGGGNLEYLVIKEAKNLLNKNISKKYLNVPLGPGIGQCCGGYVELILTLHKNAISAIENEKTIIANKKNLYIFGAGHIGQAIVSHIKDLDFNTFLIDSREDFLSMNSYNNINYLLSKEPWTIVNRLEKDSLFIVLTHSHDFDLKILNEILKINFNFAGLIGSNTKKRRFIKRLEDFGNSKKLINKIECPVGMEIGDSKDPEEIAFSIITRLILIKNKLAIDNNIQLGAAL
ncbi:xanthine dehydrogenase accessory protein XdhC [Alphaproteobacteria bacterium]|nr:xanthine dehydrogenase accessory protein XdhC [Alphaproteobacteria bacterium]